MLSAYKRGSRTRPRPEQGRLRPGAASTHGNAGRPTHRKPANGPPAPCRSPLHKADDRGAHASELVLQAPHVAVDEPIRGAPRHDLLPFEVRVQERLTSSASPSSALHPLHGLRLLAALPHRLTHCLAHRLRHEY